jgi:hypothetical protein
MPGKVNALILLEDLEMGLRKTAALMRTKSLLDRLCSLLSNGWLGEASVFLDDVHWSDVRAHGPWSLLRQSCRYWELSLE